MSIAVEPLNTASGVSARFTEAARAALARLGIEHLVLSIHQVSFPAGDLDIGYGSPYAPRATEFLAWAAALGFTGVAFGPQGITSRINPSPYDATAFSRNPLHVSVADLVARGLLDERDLASIVADTDADRARYVAAYDAARALLGKAAERALERDGAEPPELRRFRERSSWLEAESRFERIARATKDDDWTRWPEGWRASGERDRTFEMEQCLLFEQHQAFRSAMGRAGLRLYADVAIGTSFRDRALYGDLFLPGYRMGAPPSRTNPDGQPWGYPILDPRRFVEGGASRAFLSARVESLLDDYDGLRIDHPHGWVCPWAYRAEDVDPLRAVQGGARLFESPDLDDHPALAGFARVRPEQIDRERPRYADDWVKSLEPEQVDRYAVAFDQILAALRARGAGPRDLLVEVLSTCPRPLAAVLARHQLGRFRVTQKAKTEDPTDVYRGDQAKREDWIMVGNHDTPPLALVLDRWKGGAEIDRRAAYLASRLAPDPFTRVTLGVRLARDESAMVEGMLAETLVGPAKNVIVFWADLFGERRIYNRPGEVHEENWTLRVPAAFERAWLSGVRGGTAPHWGRVLALALAAKGLDRDDEGRAIRSLLETFDTADLDDGGNTPISTVTGPGVSSGS
ncbi:MAG: 4-alpha-glucanotransferase [Polyangiaceae bacterium]|nr:4-alpha-glucanotransferase [Polyangiaceae bacterium]